MAIANYYYYYSNEYLVQRKSAYANQLEQEYLRQMRQQHDDKYSNQLQNVTSKLVFDAPNPVLLLLPVTP